MKAIIRLAAFDDADQIHAIYAPIVENTAISFETEPPTAAEMARRIAGILPHFPWIVCERGGEILGYAYAAAHRSRAAYQWSVDTSIYVREEEQRTGTGRSLYSALFEILRSQGYFNAFAGIALPNAASVGLHEAVGFSPVGVYREVGYKLGHWHDVGWWQCRLRHKVVSPEAPRDLTDIGLAEGWETSVSLRDP
jgi:L-amino acid N-acyltransferase YncA